MYALWLLSYLLRQQRENCIAVWIRAISAYQKYYIFAHLINHVEVSGVGNRLLQKVIFRSCVDNGLSSGVPCTCRNICLRQDLKETLSKEVTLCKVRTVVETGEIWACPQNRILAFNWFRKGSISWFWRQVNFYEGIHHQKACMELAIVVG